MIAGTNIWMTLIAAMQDAAGRVSPSEAARAAAGPASGGPSAPVESAADLVPHVGPTFWFPEQASTVAPDSDGVFMFITWLSIFFFVLITALTVWFAFKYRRVEHSKATSAVTHNTPLELTWTIIPLILVIAIFYVGMEGYIKMRRPPAGAYEVNVIAQKWSWTFQHRNGCSQTAVLYVPVNRPVKLIMESHDVLHSLFIPAFRVKQDVVPGRYTFLWFEATKTGDFDLFCAEYCGMDHSQMVARVKVMEEDEFDLMLQECADWFKDANPDQIYAQVPNRLFGRCASCHSLTANVTLQGPSWRDTHALWGKERVLSDGRSRIVDENYIRDSILLPQRDIVMNLSGSMPTFQGQLAEEEVHALVEFIKHLDEFDEKGLPKPGTRAAEILARPAGKNASGATSDESQAGSK